MKSRLLIILFTLIAIAGCKESTTEPDTNVTSADYFPNSNGNYYYYNISALDSSGLVQSGTRKNYYYGDTTLLLTPYQIKVDSFTINGVQSVSNSFFRKSDTGVFYYVDIDTNGFNAIIPDSLRGAISFDQEYRLLYQPLELNQTWAVYKITVNYLSFQFDVFTIDAKVISKNTIDLVYRDSTVTKEVFTISYTAKLTTDLNQPALTFDANGEIAEEIGFIKWEGDSEVINFLSGRNIYLPGTYVFEELYAYKSQ
jgi:hypothetical protein